MRVLLVGPYPPPHGGVSVHVAALRRHLLEAGVACRVLDLDGEGRGEECLAVPHRLALVWQLALHAARGWTLHLHTNGHNRRSWLLALLCGLLGRGRAGSLLTLHSGLAPAYLAGGRSRSALARLVASLHRRVICVNGAIRDAVVETGVPYEKLEVLPAFLPRPRAEVEIPPALRIFLEGHRPLLSTALFFRPEYAFDLLLDAVAVLRRARPRLGCVVMGSGEERIRAEALVRSRGLGGAVLLAGDLHHDVALAVMSLSDAYLRGTFRDGDSISVREALSLGIPTVASDAAARPPGTLVFRTGDLLDYLAAIEAAIDRQRPEAGRADPGAAAAGFPGLLSAYGKAGLRPPPGRQRGTA